MRGRRSQVIGATVLLAVCGCGGGGAPADPCALTTPGAQWFAFASNRGGNYDLYAMRDDGSCLTQVTSEPGDEHFATWSPAGTIAYMSARSGSMQVYVRDFATRVERHLDVGDLRATAPAFSPDGRRIAFEGYAPGVSAVSDIYVVDADGGTPVRLTNGPRYNAGPAWSPDGTKLYFVSNRTGRYDVWTVPAAGGPETQVTDGSGILGRAAPSPDGAGIAYARSAPGEAFTEVVFRDDATGAVRLISSKREVEPTFDRTGSRIVVTSRWGASPELLLLDVATGATVRQLTADSGIDGAAAYAPFP